MLRMRRIAGNRLPPRGIDAAVEPRQDHRALVEPGDDAEQFVERRKPADEPGRDNRVARRSGAPQHRLPPQQQVPPLRRIERAFRCKDAWPGLWQDVEKPQHQLPMRREIVRRQFAQPAEIGAIDRRRVEEARQRRRQRRRLAGQKRVAALLAPAQDELRQQQAAAQFGDRRRDRQGRIVGALAAAKRDLVGFEIADRPQPRQQERRAGAARLAGQSQKAFAQRPGGAAGRQQDGHAGEAQRIARRLVEQAARQYAKKRPIRRNCVNVLLHQ